MFKVLDFTKDNVIAFLVDGRVEKQDYEKLTPMVQKAYREYDKLKFFVEIRNLTGLELSAIAEDVKFYFKFIRPADKIAIVAAGSTWEVLSKISKPFVGGDLRHFDESQIMEARDWIVKD